MKRLVIVFIHFLALTSARHYWDEDEDQPDSAILGRQIKGNITSTTMIHDHLYDSPYIDEGLHHHNYMFGGSTVVHVSKHCRLTQRKPSQAGFLWSRKPLLARQFQIDVELAIGGTENHLYGDGLAIWLVEDPFKSNGPVTGPVFGAPDRWRGLGIFIDTFANEQNNDVFPRMMGIINDGTKMYDGNRDGQDQHSGACSVPRIRESGSHELRINFVDHEFLEVLVRYGSVPDGPREAWKHCFTIYDIILPPMPLLGITAHTGQLVDNHDIMSVMAHRIAYDKEYINSTPPVPTKKTTQKGGVFFQLSIVVLFLVLAFSGFKRYQRSSAKKF